MSRASTTPTGPRRLAALAALALAAASGAARADPADTPTVVVTAVRLPADLSVTPDAYVIDRADIDAHQSVFVSDVLDQVPGVSVFSNGLFGLTSVRIRGAGSDKTLVVVDGVPVNDASQPDGAYDFSGFDLADVSRVEVLSGPQASLWGSNAIGGVVSITTRETNGLRLDAEQGAFDTTNVSGAVGKSTNQWALGFTAADIASTGISTVDPRFGGDMTDGYRDLTLGGRGRLTPTDWISIDGQVRYNKSVTAIAGYPAPSYTLADTNDIAISESTLGFAHARIDDPLGLHHDLTISDYQLRRGDAGEGGDYSYNTARQDYRWTVSGGEKGPVAFEGGVEHEDDRASVSTGQEFTLGDTSVFGIVTGKPISILSLTGSLRWDSPEHYAAQTTARGSAALTLGGGFTLLGAIGQGYKTPTISETVCDFCFPAGPSVGLRPEKALGYDTALAWRSSDGKLNARLTAYELDERDEIVYSDTYPYRYINVDRARSRGLELTGQAALPAGFGLQLSYGYTDARDLATNARQLRVPLNSGSASLLWKRGPWDAAFSVRSESSTPDTDIDGFTPVTKPGFTVEDLAGGYDLNAQIRLTARMTNLANAHYEEVYGYGEPGRALYVGLHLKL
jgi:vitamin B12 transporter